MIREERLARIVDYVQTRHFAGVDELVSALGVSKATIRRDLNSLSMANMICLRRGGATSGSNDRIYESSYDEKRASNAVEKNKLGEAACKLIKNGQAIIFDAGTSTRAMVSFMKNLIGVNLITNDIAIASDLTSHPGVDVTVVGGQLRRDYFALRGYAAEEQIKSMRADIAFIGLDAIDADSGCYITNVDEVGLKKRIIEASDKVVAICDHTKFTNSAFISFCHISEIDIVVTEKQIPHQIIEKLQQQGIEVIMV